MTVEAVLERVAASDTTADRDRLRRTVLDTIAALGLQVAGDGQVYNPAEGCYKPRPQRPSFPQQQNVHWSGGRRR